MKKPRIPKVRKTWVINSRTRIKKSKKLYRRQKAKQELKKQLKEMLKIR